MLRSNMKQFNCLKLYKSTQVIIWFITLSLFLIPQNIGAVSISKELSYTSIPNSYGDYWSADIYGSNVVYMGTDKNIYLYNTTSLETVQITSSADCNWCDLHIYGDNMVYVRHTLVSDHNYADNIVLYNLTTSTETQLTHATSSSNDAWMPEIYEDTVVWTQYNDISPYYPRINSYNIKTQTITPISTQNTEAEEPTIWGDIVTWYGYGPVYGDSWDIYYCRYRNNEGASDACKPDGSGIFKASTVDSDKYEPDTDGNLIVWSDYRNNWRSDIYVYNIASKIETRLTNTDMYSESSPKIYDGNIFWHEDAASGSGHGDTVGTMYYSSATGQTNLLSSNLWPTGVYGNTVMGNDDAGNLGILTYGWVNRPEYTLSEKPYSWDGVSTPDGSDSIDDGHQIVDLPWIFPFYENSYDKVTFSSNGWIAPGNTVEDDYYNIDMNAPPVPLIAAWNEDLDSSDQTNHPYAYSYQVKPDRVVFQWYTEAVSEGGTNKPNLFEVVLYKDGTIKFDYSYFQSDCAMQGLGKEGISPSVSGSGSTLGQVIFDGTADAFPNVCDASLAQRSFVFSLAGKQENPASDPPPLSDTEVPAPIVPITNPVTMPKTGLSIADYFRYLINLVF